MSTQPNIEAISVFVLIDGKVCLMPIAAECMPAFISMAAAFQQGQPKATELFVLPDSVVVHVVAAHQSLKAALPRNGAV